MPGAVQDRTTTVEDVLERATALAPTISARAEEVEAARRLPRDLLDELVAAGCFRVLLPRSHHGLGGDLPSVVRVYEALAAADASVGWTVMIGSGAWIDMAGLPRATFDEIFDRPNRIVAGVFNPSGSIAEDGDGYRVSGRWTFASGCEHADWIFGNCVEGLVDGHPQLRAAVFTPDQVAIEDTWSVSGMRGTGSHDFVVEDLVVPGEWTFDPLAEDPCIDEPIVRIPPPTLIPLLVTSVALGIARGALDDVVALASGKVPLLDPGPLATDPTFQLDLANADTELRAARALLRETAEDVWATATEGTRFTLDQRARVRAAGVWATDRAAEVVRTAYRAGGGSSIRLSSPLQRRLRDVDALTQHFIVKRATLATAGAVLAGQEISVPVF